MTITGALQRRPPEAVGCEESWLQTLELKMWNWKKKSFERKNPKSPKHESYRKLKQHMESGYTFGKQLLLLAKKKSLMKSTQYPRKTRSMGTGILMWHAKDYSIKRRQILTKRLLPHPRKLFSCSFCHCDGEEGTRKKVSHDKLCQKLFRPGSWYFNYLHLLHI